jgi:hypothetical protein
MNHKTRLLLARLLIGTHLMHSAIAYADAPPPVVLEPKTITGTRIQDANVAIIPPAMPGVGYYVKQEAYLILWELAIERLIKFTDVCSHDASKRLTSQNGNEAKWPVVEGIFQAAKTAKVIQTKRTWTGVAQLYMNGKQIKGFDITWADGAVETWPLHVLPDGSISLQDWGATMKSGPNRPGCPASG